MFNRDSIPDLAVASAAPGAGPLSPAGGVAILTGTGDGTFRLTQFITHTHSDNGLPVGANFVAVGDFNGGGFSDLAVAVGTNASAGDRKDGDTKLTGDDLLIFLNRNEKPDTPSAPATRTERGPQRSSGRSADGSRSSSTSAGSRWSASSSLSYPRPRNAPHCW